MRFWDARLALGVIVVVGFGCDALSPDVVVGERVTTPRPPPTRPAPPHRWEPNDALPAPVEGQAPSEFDRPAINLHLLDVNGLPATWVPGHAAELRVEIANAGPDLAPSTSIRLSLVTRDIWVEDVEVDTLISKPLAGGEHRTVKAQVTLPQWTPSASFAFEAHIDPDDVVEETIEDDNVWFGHVVDVSEVVVQPNRLEFGATQLGCGESRTLVVENRSRDRVILSSLGFESEAGSEPLRIIAPSLPRTLAPAGEDGSRLEAEVRYAPTAELETNTRIRIHTSEHLGRPMFVPVRGAGDIAPSTLDRHRQLFGPRVDFLLVLDRDVAMGPELDDLRDYVDIWLATLDARKMQYEIGLTLADAKALGGALIGPVISSEALQPARDLRAQIDSISVDPEAPGTGLEAARLSVTHHRHWFRSDAALLVVFLSTRDDRSDGPVDGFIRAIVDAKPSPEDVAANAIVLDGSARCDDTPPAERYIDVVQALGGRLDPICDLDAYASLWALPHRGFGLWSEFELSRASRGETLTVRVDGRLEPPVDLSGRQVWSFDRWSRSVKFEPRRTPGPGAVVDLEYVSVCD